MPPFVAATGPSGQGKLSAFRPRAERAAFDSGYTGVSFRLEAVPRRGTMFSGARQ